jgi:hypothetical protein
MSDKRQVQEALLKKVDSLLAKHRPQKANQGLEALLDVPLLTDIAEESEPPTLTDALEDEPPSAAPAAPTASGAARMSRDEVRVVASDIFARILNHLDERLAAELQRRVQEQVNSAVEIAVGSMLADLRRDVLNTVGDAIAEALVDHLGDRRARGTAAGDAETPEA